MFSQSDARIISNILLITTLYFGTKYSHSISTYEVYIYNSIAGQMGSNICISRGLVLKWATS